MAKIYPDNLTNFNYTGSEKAVYQALKKLSDDYTVFFSVPWQQKNRNGHETDGECDFVIVKKNCGYIALEVKGGKNISIVDNVWQIELDGGNTHLLKRNPADQARESSYFFRDYYKEKTGNSYKAVYGYAVCFPYFSVKEDLDMQTPREIIIDAHKFENLPKAIDRVFDYYQKSQNYKGDGSELDIFIDLVNTKRHFAILKGKLIKSQEERFEEINLVQDTFLDFIKFHRKAMICGGAGTGKTFIALKKAIRSADEERSVLFLCYNRRLSEYLRHRSIKDIQFYNYHAFAEEVLGKDNYQTLFDLTNGSMESIEYEFSMTEWQKYDTIIIDEAQDFQLEWFDSLQHLLNTDGEFYIFYDREQAIFDGHIGEIEKRFDLPPFFLNRNLRNSAKIQNWANNTTGLGLEIIPNSLQGVKPVRSIFDESSKAIKEITKIVNKLIVEEMINFSQIVLLSDRTVGNSILSNIDKIGNYKITTDYEDRSNLRFLTIQSFKGMEEDVVIFLAHGKNRDKLNFVAYTRARYLLYVVEVNK
ncbi:MAG: AAA family ATPase [Candidatus Delongbacteria bacterium]|nr:AAA family ATPase [Candidatus Delongbacteria bacterium]MBN2834597.1 AAA family ATPase [Candidatus Delongbacteria bacterium]